MAPKRHMDDGDPWWPKELGDPSPSGSQNGMRYVFSPDKRRLVVETDGITRTYESGDHEISGVSQADGGSITVAGTDGTVDLSHLRPAT